VGQASFDPVGRTAIVRTGEHAEIEPPVPDLNDR
jgi:hypothetical protein